MRAPSGPAPRVRTMTASGPLRVILADDHYLIREGMRSLLELADDLDVVAAVGNAPDLLDSASRLDPDVVVTDIRMPAGTEGITAARALRARQPGVGIVVLSQFREPSYAMELMADGAAGIGYLLKDRIGDFEELTAAIRSVAAGRSCIDPVVVDALVRRRSQAEASPLHRLSAREIEVLHAMAEGQTNTRIAQSLHLSTSSVEKHVNAILTKLDLPPESEVHRRVSAVVTYLRHPKA